MADSQFHIECQWTGPLTGWACFTTPHGELTKIVIEKIDAIRFLGHQPALASANNAEDANGGTIWANGTMYSVSHTVASELWNHICERIEAIRKIEADQARQMREHQAKAEKFWDSQRTRYKSNVFDNRPTNESDDVQDPNRPDVISQTIWDRLAPQMKRSLAFDDLAKARTTLDALTQRAKDGGVSAADVAELYKRNASSFKEAAEKVDEDKNQPSEG